MMRYRIRGISVLAALVMLGGLLCQCGPSLVPEPTEQPGSTTMAPEVKPPPAVLEVDGQEQISGIGSYCWSDPEEDVGVCADTIGIIAPENPMDISASFTLKDDPHEFFTTDADGLKPALLLREAGQRAARSS